MITWSHRFENVRDCLNAASACYIFEGAPGLEPLAEIAPTAEEKAGGWFYHSQMLDMFWLFRPDGKSYLDEKLKAEGWTLWS